MRPLTPLFLLGFLLLFSRDGYGAIVTGIVVDRDARPVPRALLTAVDATGREHGRTFTTTDGHFSINGPDTGGCFLEAQLTGFVPVRTDCGNGKPLRIVLVIAPLEEAIVVSATRGDAPLGQIGSSVTVFTGGEIERRQQPMLADLLRTSAGTTIVGAGPPGGITSLFVRGGESSYTKVLLDGVPLNEPGGPFDFSNVSTAHIGRVELVRGAQSALFGSDAMAGVLQMFTRRARPGAPIADATFEAGSFGTVRAGATFARASHSWDYSVHASRLTTDNDVENNDFGNTTLSGSAGVEVDERTSVRVVGRTELGRAGTPGQTGFGRPDLDAFYKRRYGVTGIAFAQQLSPLWHHTASYSWSATNQTSTNLVMDPPYTPSFEGRTSAFESFDFPYDRHVRLRRHHAMYQADVRMTRVPRRAGEHLLTAALEWDGERGSIEDKLASTTTRASRNNVGTTVQEQVLWPRVFATVGVRFEHNASFGFAAVPRASIAVIARQSNGAFGTTTFKAAAGAGIKEPTIDQSFSTSPFFLGNPDLEPERSRTADVGIAQQIVGGAATIELTWFANRFRDIISTRTLSFNPFRSQFFNIGLTRARGFELGGTMATSMPMRLQFGYTYLVSRILSSASPDDPIFGEGSALFRRPRHSGFVSAELHNETAAVNVISTFVGRAVDSDFSSLVPAREFNEGHVRWDVRSSYELSRRFTIVGAVDNLFNRRYMEPLGYPVLGRAARAGIHIKF